MSDPVWPEALPQAPQRDGYQESTPDVLLESKPDIGPAKTRPLATSGEAALTVRYRMSGVQLVTFRAWFSTTLAHGARPFVWPDPVSGEVARVRITKPVPAWVPAANLADRWDLTINLMRLPA
ncbi:hypothetical protein P7L78_19085 [Tistrella bauzanensis]|uniref:hypothetical protein n=1 Tax=Tistrella TaxID=171436 RepID=UPI0031F65F80